MFGAKMGDELCQAGIVAEHTGLEPDEGDYMIKPMWDRSALSQSAGGEARRQ
jgi:hypothetical protein